MYTNGAVPLKSIRADAFAGARVVLLLAALIVSMALWAFFTQVQLFPPGMQRLRLRPGHRGTMRPLCSWCNPSVLWHAATGHSVVAAFAIVWASAVGAMLKPVFRLRHPCLQRAPLHIVTGQSVCNCIATFSGISQRTMGAKCHAAQTGGALQDTRLLHSATSVESQTLPELPPGFGEAGSNATDSAATAFSQLQPPETDPSAACHDETMRLAVTGTTNEPLHRILPWIRYHQLIGFSLFYLFAEGSAQDPAVVNVLRSLVGVKVRGHQGWAQKSAAALYQSARLSCRRTEHSCLMLPGACALLHAVHLPHTISHTVGCKLLHTARAVSVHIATQVHQSCHQLVSKAPCHSRRSS